MMWYLNVVVYPIKAVRAVCLTVAVGGKGRPVDRAVISIARAVGGIAVKFPPPDQSAFKLASIAQLSTVISTHRPQGSVRPEEQTMVVPRSHRGIGIGKYRIYTNEHNEGEKDWKGKVFHFLRSFTGYGVPTHSFLK